MIVPTIGRIVWFHATPPSPDNRGPKYQPEAGMVAYVLNDRLVNLMVADRNGRTRSEIEIPLMQDDDEHQMTGSYAEWMPYQKGQAAKHDALADGYHKLP